jgi:hypothetical protein
MSAIDEQIATLKQARSFDGRNLAGRGGPRSLATVVKPAKKGNISPEGRKRIVEGVQQRLAAQKKGAGK